MRDASHRVPAPITSKAIATASPSARNFLVIREAMEVTPEPPPYLERDKDAVTGRLVRNPERDEIPLFAPVDERLIVELASRSTK